MTNIPDIWIFEDEPSTLSWMKGICNTEIGFSSIKRFKKTDLKFPTPDLVISDICLESGESDKISDLGDDYAILSTISGIDLLTWLRHHLPLVPVLMYSAYYPQTKSDSYAPPLTQHALSLFDKNICLSNRQLFKIIIDQAHLAIIGIKLTKNIDVETAKLIRKVIESLNKAQKEEQNQKGKQSQEKDSEQNHFYFKIFRENKELLEPRDYDKFAGSPLKFNYFEVWNSRILGIIDLDPNQNSDENRIIPVLPFGHNKVTILNFDLKEHLNFEGTTYLNARLIALCIKIVYKIYFDMDEHGSKNTCLLSNSQYTTEMKKCFHACTELHTAGLCEKCQEEKDKKQKKACWNQGKEEALDFIFKRLKKELGVF